MHLIGYYSRHCNTRRGLVSFGSRLRQERTRLGLTQQQLAELGGVKRLSQHLYEQDVRVPDTTYLMRLIGGGADEWFLISGTRSGSSNGETLPRSVYVSAFRAVDELARDADGQPLPLAERERLFDFLLTLLQNESSSASLNDIKSRLSALVA